MDIRDQTRFPEWDFNFDFSPEEIVCGYVLRENVNFIYWIENISVYVRFEWKRDDTLRFQDFNFNLEGVEPYNKEWIYTSNAISVISKRQIVRGIVDFMITYDIRKIDYQEEQVERARWVHELRGFYDILDLAIEKLERINTIVMAFCDRAYRLEEKTRACNLISIWWKRQLVSPYTRIGKKKLLKEFESLIDV